MRWIPIVLVVLLLVPASASTSQANSSLADEAGQAFVDLKLSALSSHDPDRDPVQRLEAAVRNATNGSAGQVLDAWRAAQNASGSDAREAILVAEAALLAHARDEAHAALAAGNATAARAWLRIPLERVHWQARSIPAKPVLEGQGLDRENLTELIDSALAIRAREAIIEALLLNHAGARDQARATADGAEALVDVLVPEASRRLPDALRAPLEENATGLAGTILAVPRGTSEHFLTGLIAPLTALEYDHRIEVLEEFGARNVDPAFVVARAALEDSGNLDAFATEAFARYATDRGRLFMMGEGTRDGENLIGHIDAAYLELRRAAENESVPRTRQAAAQVADSVAQVALLDPGFTLKIETGGVQPNRTHTYNVAFLRPSLEGVTRYRLDLTYDPAVIEIVDVTSRSDVPQTLSRSLEEGRAVIEAILDPPLVENVRLIDLHLEARGEPLSETNITIEEATFREADGDRLEPFRLRNGHATVAKIGTQDDAGADEANRTGSRATPAPTALYALLAALIAAARPRGS